jgi:hypothetical protein
MLLKVLAAAQLVKKIAEFCRARMIMHIFATAQHNSVLSQYTTTVSI